MAAAARLRVIPQAAVAAITDQPMIVRTLT
jgi:hypothetical protein